MHKLLAIISLVAIGISGCSSGGGNPPPEEPPNLYQPVSPADSCQGEIEYKWTTVNGEEKHSFHESKGDFCTYLDKAPETPVFARCVVRKDGEVIPTSTWVESVFERDFMKFLLLCPEAEPVLKGS